mmetsp:Transcript_39197/g.113152  ORF Transcript_39197/g.113152 Transcript_39197/m.113152 type:complete len:226 (-) Transcript_39197:557-1234(-)
MVATVRRRRETPWSHVAEQIDHSVHAPHVPSMQTRWYSHFCMLQGSTSSLSPSMHLWPPPLGSRAISRPRSRVPPPQVQVQALQGPQPPHLQSWIRQASWSHGRVCARAWSQPAPCWPASTAISRLRDCWPTPHVEEQAPHSSQVPMTQFSGCTLQVLVLQPEVSMRAPGHVWPPRSGKRWIWRWRSLWPPPQVLSHEDHGVQGDITQSTTSKVQVSVSFIEPKQ